MSRICSYFQPNLPAIFVTIATVEVELIPDFYTWAFVYINLEEETSKKQLLLLVSRSCFFLVKTYGCHIELFLNIMIHYVLAPTVVYNGVIITTECKS